MPYRGLIKMYTERKNKLSELLNEDSVELKPERLHSIKGAVDEIEMFINVLNQHQEEAGDMIRDSQAGSLMSVQKAMLREELI